MSDMAEGMVNEDFAFTEDDSMALRLARRNCYVFERTDWNALDRDGKLQRFRNAKRFLFGSNAAPASGDTALISSAG